MNDEELLKRARNEWELSGVKDHLVHFPELGEAMHNLFNRFEQMLDDKEPKSIVWEPKKGEWYYFVQADGEVWENNWNDSQIDKSRLKYHNVYKTRELAEKTVPHLSRYNMVLQAVLNLEPNQVVDWSGHDQAKYGVGFDHNEGVWYRSTCFYLEHLYPPLTDEKNVQPLLDYLNAKGGE